MPSLLTYSFSGEVHVFGLRSCLKNAKLISRRAPNTETIFGSRNQPANCDSPHWAVTFCGLDFCLENGRCFWGSAAIHVNRVSGHICSNTSVCVATS